MQRQASRGTGNILGNYFQDTSDHKLTKRRAAFAGYDMAMPAQPEPAGNPIDLSRIAALDVGERRIGVAISDALGYTAQPLLTYNRVPYRDGHADKRDAKSLLRLLRKAGCRSILVGNPLYLSGEPSPQAERVYRFVEALRLETELPIQLWDERLSTSEAHSILDSAGHAVREREDIIDQVAAVLILQSYMQTMRPQLLSDPSTK